MAGVNVGVAQAAARRALDKVFYLEFDYPSIPGLAQVDNAGVFRQETHDRNVVVTEQYMGPGYFQERAEQQDVPSAPIEVGNRQTISILNYANSVDISKNFFDDDQHAVVRNVIADMGRKAKLTRDKDGFNLYNLSFTTALSNDAVSIFNNSHVTLKGGTVDNLETGTLTPANFETMYVSLVQQKTQDETLGGHNPATLLVPPTLFPDAQEITKSELQPGTGNNNANWVSLIYPGLRVMQTPFVSSAFSGSNTAWFVLSRNHGFTRWVRQGIETRLMPWENQRNNNYIYKAEYREAYAAPTWEGSAGSTGAV